MEARAASRENAASDSHDLLRLDFGQELIPKIPSSTITDNSGKQLTIAEVMTAIEYQLHERLAFVGPPDPMLGSLLEDLADYRGVKKGVEYALPIYEIALEYGASDPELVRKRMAHYQELVLSSESARWWLEYGAWFQAGGVVIALILFAIGSNAYRRKTKNSRVNETASRP